jgi:hypothetical protein
MRVLKKLFITIVSIVVISIVVIGGFYFYKISTPEYALTQTIKDVKSSGIDGLKNHLTSNAVENINAIEGWTDKFAESNVLLALTKDSLAAFLLEKMSEMNWTVDDILRGKGRADVMVGFDYNDSIIGTLELTMIRERGEWKIDSFKISDFEKVSFVLD